VRRLPLALYGVLAGLILWRLWPAVPAALRLPLLAYVFYLASMAAQAAVVGLLARGTPGQRRAELLTLGGALFLVSDALLAIHRFAAPLPLSGLWILVHLLAGAVVHRVVARAWGGVACA